MNRGTVWSDKEVKALIAIWGESNVQEELDGAVRNQAIYQRIAKQLREQGYGRDWKQCCAKIKNLKTKYREIKDHNGEQDGGERHASSTKSLIEFWDTGQPQFLLPCLILVILPAPWLNLKKVKKK